MIKSFFQDLRHAARTFRSAPLGTGAAVLTLALGIGATTGIVSVLDAVLLEPLPYRHADRLYRLAKVELGSFQEVGSRVMSYPDYVDVRAAARLFEAMASADYTLFAMSGGEVPEEVVGGRVSASMFDVLGVTPALGRRFLPDDDTPAAPPVALLSHALWRRAFSADSQVIGRHVGLNGTRYAVVGVLPEGFRMPRDMRSTRPAEVWVPLAPSAFGAAEIT